MSQTDNTLDTKGKPPVSNCHKAPLKVISGKEGTSYWICSKCEQPADPYVEDNRELASYNTLDKVLDDYTHFFRVCINCGKTWWGLHCPHDGIQNPCPSCNKKPETLPGDIEHCDCEFVINVDEVKSISADREKKMLEFVIPQKLPKNSNEFSEAFISGRNRTIDEVRQRAKEWSKK